MKLEDFVKGKANLAGLIGNPVSHTFSPYIFNTLSKIFGCGLVYLPFGIDDPKRLGIVVKALKELSIVGFNVTIPYKQQIIGYIDGIDEEAESIGAVNTVTLIDGRFYGTNTDITGFIKAFHKQTGCGFGGKTVAVLGAGGASRAIVQAIAGEGAGKINIINRTYDKACEIEKQVNQRYGDIAEAFGLSSGIAPEIISSGDIIVNTTPLGMHGFEDISPLPDGVSLRKGMIVYDTVYRPLKTALLNDAESAGCITAGGVGMLVYQAVAAFELWTGIKAASDDIAGGIMEALINELGRS